MAQHTPPTEGSLANADDLREEERLEDALEHLKVLHLQLRALRQTIPKLIEPLAKPQQSSSRTCAPLAHYVDSERATC